MTRTTRTTSIGDHAFDVYEPTDGQIAILMQQARIAKRAAAGKADESAFMAMGVVMTILDKLFVDPADQDLIAEQVIDGTLSLTDVMDAILRVNETGEVSDAAPQTVVKRTRSKS